ncbi:hypothetical protein [Citricoccus sp. I39-566]|uniref:hypothetical protein n=1 Tax=Citricoccus sp. I39-566 TaxID=3073268 RepID=UPI00286A16C9|nr:hypothetical protein [Citricoccus sp. I39-566]WMY77956.1 hypothetical protein RE421_14190 [Citricoccus sp. I39-566]
MTDPGSPPPAGSALEGAVDGNPVSIVPVPVTDEGFTDWVALAASLPPRPVDGPALPESEGWVQIPVAGADQTLYWAQGSRYEGIMPEISLRHVRSADASGLLAGAHSAEAAGGLPLGVEPWVAGAWRGIHSAWSLSRYASTVIWRQWVLDAGPHGLVEVVARHNAYLSRHLISVVNGLVAGIAPAPAAGGDLAGDLDWAVAAAARAREALAEAAPEGLVGPTTLGPVERDRIVAGFASGPGWDIAAGGDGATGRGAARRVGRLWTSDTQCLVEHAAPGLGDDGSVRLGRYVRDDAADMVLRVVGHRPAGPSDVPVSLLPAEAFSARLHDRTVPLPPDIPEGAVVSRHLDPQDIYRWWTADWSWWTLHRDAGPGQGAEGVRVLTVAGFGHYLWDGGDAIGLRPVDGLALFGVLTDLIGPGRS